MEEFKFETLDDIINLITRYKTSRKRKRKRIENVEQPPEQLPEPPPMEYNSDIERLVPSLYPLRKLNALIGMETIKRNIIDQVLFYTQELNSNEMMHTCLTGPPGVGKTTLGKILSELYCSLGFLETDNFKVVTKTDLVAGYVGQTAIKTTKVLKSALGGVLFLDEAYSIGAGTSTNDSDSFGKECIDTINQFLSEHTSNFIMIIAGYREELDHSFFGLNKGLARRFPWNYDIEKYSNRDLKRIFIHQVNANDWNFDESVKFNNYQLLDELFLNADKETFTQNAGDTLLLFDKVKICHSRRVFGLRKKYKKVIDISDIKLGMELVKSFKTSKKNLSQVPYGMYV
jgi:SpoVK/Ycf46/Vps4 family AAA+-type ATPase